MTATEIRTTCNTVLEATEQAITKLTRGCEGEQPEIAAALVVVAGMSGSMKAQFEIAAQLAELNEKLDPILTMLANPRFVPAMERSDEVDG